MSAYGKYQTVSELSHQSRTAVFTARQGPNKPAVFAVKVFQPVALPGAAINDVDGQRAFLESVALQRTAASKRSRHWAPVYEAGDFAGGAFYVTRHYSRSLERLIDGRLRVDSEVLLHLVRSLVRALRELESRGGHAHGNLKATNVFFSGQGPLLNSRLLVADPAPPAPPEARAAATAADFKALGSLIFRLVRRHDVRGEVPWPITASPDWEALGDRAEVWRELCNRLLDPQAPARGLTLTEIEAQLRKIKFRGVSRRFVVTVLILPSAVLFSGLSYLRFASYERMPEWLVDYAEAIGNVPPDATEPPPEWTFLCRAYYDWFGVVQRALEDPTRLAAWKQNRVLSEKVLSDLAKNAAQYDPRALAHVQGDLQVLANSPPAAVMKGATRWHIVHAWWYLFRIKSELDEWMSGVPLLETSGRYAKAGWTEPANELKAAFSRRTNHAPSADGVDEYVALKAKIHEIDTGDNQLARQKDLLTATQDSLLSGLVDTFRTPLNHAADLSSLDGALADANQAAAHWVNFVQGPWTHSVERARFERESAVAKEQGPLSPERIARWELEVQAYTLAPSAEDPRSAINWTELKAALAKHLSAYRAEEVKTAVKSGPDVVSGQSLQESAEALAQSVTALANRVVIRKDLDEVKTRVTQLANEHRALGDRIANAMLQLRPNVAEWLNAVKGTFFPESPKLQAAWKTHTTPLLENVTAPQLAEDDVRFQQLRNETHAIEIFLRLFISPRALPPAILSSESWPEALRNELTAWLKTEYESTLDADLKAIDWTAPPTPTTAEALLASPSLVAARTHYEAARQAVSAFGRDLADLSTLLAAGKGLDEGVTEVAERTGQNPTLAALRERGTPRALLEAVAELRRIAIESDPHVLSGRVTAGAPAAALAAWRRLGTLPDWPHAEAGLTQEKALASALLPRMTQANTSEPARQQLLAAEFAREGRTRWRKALRTSTTSAEVSAVFAHQADYGLQEAELDEFARYALDLNQLKTDILTASTASEASAVRAMFTQKVQTLPTVATRPEIAHFLDALQQIVLTEGDPVSDLRRLGPVNHGWQVEVAPDAKDAAFHWTTPAGQSHALEFRLVELSNGDPFFLATTETSVGLLLDLTVADEKLFANYLPTWIKEVQSTADDQRQGPQTWIVDLSHKGRLRLNNKWTADRNPDWPDKIYPAGLAITPPTRQSPAQYLDPTCARFIAEKLLNCRLPTPQEWTELLALLGRDALQKTVWNLRDKTWQKEQDYLAGASQAFNLPWPDGDSFTPPTSPTLRRGREAIAATAADDQLLWFADVDKSENGAPFAHLFGNVAEYLWNPQTGKYSVAGGSALSPAELDPAATYAVDTQQERDGYSDVGFRLAFSAPDSLVGKSRLTRLIRDQGFLGL